MKQDGRTFGPGIHTSAQQFAARMRELYEQHGYIGEAFVLLAGVSNGEPAIYGWDLKRDREGPRRQRISLGHIKESLLRPLQVTEKSRRSRR